MCALDMTYHAVLDEMKLFVVERLWTLSLSFNLYLFKNLRPIIVKVWVIKQCAYKYQNQKFEKQWIMPGID